LPRQVLFSTMCSACAERDVPFGRDVDFVSDVRFAREAEHITSLCAAGAIHHCASAQHHCGEAATSLFDFKVFQNFVDAFPRGALLAHHFGAVDRFELPHHFISFAPLYFLLQSFVHRYREP